MTLPGHRSSPAHKETVPAPATGEATAGPSVLNAQEWRDINEAYVAKALEDGTDLSTLRIDIDATKAVNDDLGHHMGDRLIELVEGLNRRIVENVRTKHDPKYPDRNLDLVTSNTPTTRPLGLILEGIKTPAPRAERIGGDEFGITLPDTDRAGANALAERLRAAVAEELALPHNSPLAEMGAGISIGVATLEPGMTTADFLRYADKMMYADKLRRLRPLSPQEEADFTAAVDHLEKAGVRPRDVPKYIEMLGASALLHAIEERDERISSGQLVLTPPETT